MPEYSGKILPVFIDKLYSIAKFVQKVDALNCNGGPNLYVMDIKNWLNNNIEIGYLFYVFF